MTPLRRFDNTRGGISMLVALVLVIGYFAYVAAFGVNVPFWDEWELLPRFQRFYNGSMPFTELIASKHNEHLIGTAFTVMLFQHLITGFDVRALLFSDAALQILNVGLVMAIARREGLLEGKSVYVYAAAITAALLSLAQYKNVLWGFQTAWYLVTFFFLLSIYLLSGTTDRAASRGATTRQTLLAAIPAVLASFTSFHGVLIWVAGAVYLMARREVQLRRCFADTALVCWLVSAGATLAVFGSVYASKGLGGPGGHSVRALLEAPLVPIGIFVGTYGSIVGSAGKALVLAVALALFALIGVLVWWCRRAADRRIYAAPLALIIFSLLFSALVAAGRAPSGISAARDSHYTAYTTLAVAGLLLAFAQAASDGTTRRLMARTGRNLLLALIVIATVSSTYTGIVAGIQWRTEQGIAAVILRDYQSAEDFELQRLLFGDADLVRRNADFMHTHALGLFGDPQAVPADIARGYGAMPASMTKVAIRYPEARPALDRLWRVYRVGSDLRSAFDPSSENFAHDLIKWASGASADGSHYLSAYLTEFSVQYSTLRQALESKP